MNLKYSPVNWLIVDWSYGGTRFNDCGLPEPLPCPTPRPPLEPVCVPLPIQEAIDTYDWERFLPEIMVGIEDADEEIAANYAREAAIDFTKRARVLQREVVVPLEKGVCKYSVEPYDSEQIVGVIGVSIDGNKPVGCGSYCRAMMPNGIDFIFDAARNEIHLQGSTSSSCCHSGKTLRMLVWSAPTEDCCLYDRFLYDHYRKDITLMARRNYVRALHFRDHVLMRSLQPETEYERAVLIAKKNSMARHSWSHSQTGSGLFALTNRRGMW